MHLLFGIRAILDCIKNRAIKVIWSSREFHLVWSYFHFTCVVLYTRCSLQNWYLPEGWTVTDLKSKCVILISQYHDNRPPYHILTRGGKYKDDRGSSMYIFLHGSRGRLYTRLYITCPKQLLRALLNYIVSIKGTIFLGILYVVSTMYLSFFLYMSRKK